MRRTLAACACVMFGEWALIAALSIHAYSVDGAVAVGLLGLRFIPAAATGLVAPRIIERRQPAAILRFVAVSRALWLGALAALVAVEAPFAAVLAVLMADGAVSALYRPAQAALLPSLASTAGELTAAAGLIGNVRTLSQVSGAFLGGALAVGVSTEAVAAGAAALMLIAAILVPRHAGRATPLRDVGLAGLPPAPIERKALNVAALASIRALIRGMWLAVVVVVAIRLIDLGASGVGLMMGASAAGAVLALPVAIRLFGSARLALGLGAALATAGAAIAALAVWHSPEIALALVALHGLGMAVAEAASLGLLHRLLDTRGVSRLVGPMESAKLAFEGAGSLLAPALLAVAGTRGALAIVGSVPVALVALDWRSLHQIDATAGERTRLVDLLREVEIFRGLSIAGLEEIAAGSERQTFGDEDEVICQGDPGDTFYVVERGQAEVLIDGYRVGVLSRGMAFGERALLRGGNRAATVRALGELRVVATARDVFLAAVAGGQRVMARSQAAPDRSLPELLGSMPLFARMPHETLRRTAEQFEVADYAPNSELVRQGDQGDHFFVLLTGTAQVIVDGSPVGELIAGDGFGEIALLHDVPRRATVQATQAVRAAVLARDAYVEFARSADARILA
jgi:CRP-like cAMP-binding protein